MVSISSGRSGRAGFNPNKLFGKLKGQLAVEAGTFVNAAGEANRIASIEGNPFLEGITGGLEAVQQRAQGLAASLPGRIKSAGNRALDQGVRAAALNARIAGGGRGGLGFGGGAGALAARAGSDIASQVGASTQGAIIQGDLTSQQILADISSRLGAARSQQSQIFQAARESEANRFLTARQRVFEIFGNIATAGISGAGSPTSTSKQRSFGFLSR